MTNHTTAKLTAALIAAGHGNQDGTVNTYSAAKAGVCDSSTLGKILRGERSPSVAVLERILAKIGMTIEFVPINPSRKRKK